MKTSKVLVATAATLAGLYVINRAAAKAVNLFYLAMEKFEEHRVEID